MEGFTLIILSAAGRNGVQKISLPRGKNREEIFVSRGCENTDLVLKLPPKIRHYLPVKEVFHAHKYFFLFTKK